MLRPEYEALLRRRRIWGVPPDAVERIAADCEQTEADLHARMRELEIRLSHLTAERDEAEQAVAPLREQVTRLERENTEIASRPELVREEALRFVVDAWAEAQTIREQTRQEIAQAEEATRTEVAAMRQALAEERERHEAEMRAARERHEAEIAMLRERRLKAIAELESLAETLLNQASRSAALKTSETAAAPPEPDADAPPATAATETAAAPHASSAVADAPADTAPAPIAGAPHALHGDDPEDRLLAKALDDLAAVLSAPRASNGTG